MTFHAGRFLACYAATLTARPLTEEGAGLGTAAYMPPGLTILHSVAGAPEHVTPEERVAFATMLLDAGARLDIRDNLLKSTPPHSLCCGSTVIEAPKAIKPRKTHCRSNSLNSGIVGHPEAIVAIRAARLRPYRGAPQRRSSNQCLPCAAGR